MLKTNNGKFHKHIVFSAIIWVRQTKKIYKKQKEIIIDIEYFKISKFLENKKIFHN